MPMADQGNPISAHAKREEVRKNYEVFQRLLPELLVSHKGKFALMHEGTVVEYFDTPGDAYRAGQKLYPDGLFSIQEVTASPVDLGFFSYAISHR